MTDVEPVGVAPPAEAAGAQWFTRDDRCYTDRRALLDPNARLWYLLVRTSGQQLKVERYGGS
jgi:hypothetical protein